MNYFTPVDQLPKKQKLIIEKAVTITDFKIIDYFEDDNETCFNAKLEINNTSIKLSCWWISPKNLGHFQYCTKNKEAQTFVLDYLKQKVTKDS